MTFTFFVVVIFKITNHISKIILIFYNAIKYSIQDGIYTHSLYVHVAYWLSISILKWCPNLQNGSFIISISDYKKIRKETPHIHYVFIFQIKKLQKYNFNWRKSTYGTKKPGLTSDINTNIRHKLKIIKTLCSSYDVICQYFLLIPKWRPCRPYTTWSNEKINVRK